MKTEETLLLKKKRITATREWSSFWSTLQLRDFQGSKLMAVNDCMEVWVQYKSLNFFFILM